MQSSSRRHDFEVVDQSLDRFSILLGKRAEPQAIGLETGTRIDEVGL